MDPPAPYRQEKAVSALPLSLWRYRALQPHFGRCAIIGKLDNQVVAIRSGKKFADLFAITHEYDPRVEWRQLPLPEHYFLEWIERFGYLDRSGIMKPPWRKKVLEWHWLIAALPAYLWQKIRRQSGAHTLPIFARRRQVQKHIEQFSARYHGYQSELTPIFVGIPRGATEPIYVTGYRETKDTLKFIEEEYGYSEEWVYANPPNLMITDYRYSIPR